MTRDGTWASKTGIHQTAHVPRKGGMVRNGGSVIGAGMEWQRDGEKVLDEAERKEARWEEGMTVVK